MCLVNKNTFVIVCYVYISLKEMFEDTKGVLFRTRYSVLMDEYLHSHLNVRLALVVRRQQVYH
jgi:hypothetical protein